MAKTSKVGCWIAIALLSIALFWSVVMNLGLLALFGSGSGQAEYDYPVDEAPEFEEVWSYGSFDAYSNKVVRIELSGVIMRGQRERLIGHDPDMVGSILAQILAAKNDPYVKAILLEVDSPGGAVTPSDEIYTALKMFRQSEDGRKVMVFIRGLGASGAYYAAMAGDCIMAEPTAIVGSVGVIMQAFNMKELGDKIGLKSVTITSGANKDMLNPFEEVNPEHIEMIQGLIDELQDRFAAIVMESRGLESRELLDGRVFSAEQALDNGLIDGVGYWLESVDMLKELLDAEAVYMVRYSEPMGFLDSLFGAKTPRMPGIDALESPRFLYQWKPLGM
jgi:protease-4